MIRVPSLRSQDSSSDSDLSLEQDSISVNENWIQEKIKIKVDLFLCPICYEFVFQPVQCKSCGRLFCKRDYNQCKTTTNQCPLCKCTPWQHQQNIHISYKAILEQITFKCQLCPKKKMVKQEFMKHLEESHGKKIDLLVQQLYDYTLQYEDGSKKVLDTIRNTQINYKQYIQKTSSQKKITLLDNQDEAIYISLGTKKFKTKGGKKGKLILKKSKQIQHNKQYIIWMFESHYEKKQFYLQDHQKIMEENYKVYKQNPALNEIHFDTANKSIRYRMMYDDMIQVNVKTKFQRNVQRVNFMFKE